jgi:hypothetical protein
MSEKPKPERDRRLRIPLPPEEAMADLLKVPPPPEKKRRGEKSEEAPTKPKQRKG